jgi:hypothetical protein
MRNAHRALNTCHEVCTIGQKLTSGNSKTIGCAGKDVRGFSNLLTRSGLRDPLGGLASRALHI